MNHCPVCQEPSPESARSCSVCGTVFTKKCCHGKFSAWWLLPILILAWVLFKHR